MIRSCLRPVYCGLSLLVLVLSAARSPAQTPAANGTEPAAPAQASQPAASQPATAPQAYRIKLNNMLVYQVLINARSSQNPNAVERTDRRELAVFDLDDGGNVVLYIGVPKDSKPIGSTLTMAAPQQPVRRDAREARESREARAAIPAAPATEAKPEKPKNVELTWTKHVLGKPENRGDDGTVTIRPEPSAAAYPVLPLPAADIKAKEKFEVTLPDMAAGSGKTLDLAGQWQPAGTEKVAVSARLEPKITPGVPPVPETAFFRYEVASNEPAAVTLLSESRRMPGETPAASGAEHGEAPHTGIGVSAGGPRPKPAPGARPAAPAVPVISVSVRLDKTVPLTEDQRKAMLSQAAGHGASGEDAGKVAPDEKEQAPSGDVQNLIDQVQGWGQGTKEQLQKTPGQ